MIEHPDPLHLAHRIHVSTGEHGLEARCTCGWSTVRASRDARQRDIDAHHAVRRTLGSHGVVSEGD
jgi:hypothetical protein